MWHKILLNRQNMQKEYDTSALIKMPSKSNFRGCYFFHPLKLVRTEGHKGYLISISYTDGWIFKIYKNGELVEEVDGDIMAAEFQNRNYRIDDADSYLEIHEPKKICTPVEIDKELLR